MISIVDNRLLELPGEIIPLSAISSVAVTAERPRLFAGLALGSLLVLIGCGFADANRGVMVALITLGVLTLIGGLKTIVAPKRFLTINLHSGRTLDLDIGGRRRDLRTAQDELARALLDLPPGPALAPHSVIAG